MKKKKKILIFGGIALAIVLIIVINLSTSGEKTFKVQAEKVNRKDITSLVTANGKIEPKTSVKISAYVPAKIVSLPVKEGDRVRKGQVLVVLDQTRYQAAVDQARAALSNSQAQLRLEKANLEQTQLVYERIKQLYEKNLTSQQEYDQARTNYNVAKARYEASEHSVAQNLAFLEQAEDDLSKTIITSPINGLLTELNAEVGEIVLIGTMNNPGTVIMTISDLSEIEAKVEVDETDVALVRLGQEAKIKVDAFPDTTFKGKVSEVGNTGKVTGLGTQDQVINFMVKILLLDKVPGIKPGMSTTVDVITDERFNVLNVPIQAVVLRAEEKEKKNPKTDDKSEALADVKSEQKPEQISKKKKEQEGVFMIKERKAVFVPVKTGVADQQNIEIISGLNEKDEIITGSYKILRTLKHGDPVKVEKKITPKEEK